MGVLSSTAYKYALQNIYLYLCIATHIHSHDVQIMTLKSLKSRLKQSSTIFMFCNTFIQQFSAMTQLLQFCACVINRYSIQ